MKLPRANKICKKLSHQYGIVNPPNVIPMPYSRIGNRAAIGYYDDDTNQITLNKYILELWPAKEIVETIQHELAHARCYRDFGHGGHGKHFREICQMLGLPDAIIGAVKKENQENLQNNGGNVNEL